MPKVKFIDLFAGLGGIRLGFEKSFQDLGFETECVMTSEIKPYAIKTLSKNFSHDYFVGDIFQVENKQIPAFDLLGNTVAVPVVEHVTKQLAEIYKRNLVYSTVKEIPVCS